MTSAESDLAKRATMPQRSNRAMPLILEAPPAPSSVAAIGFGLQAGMMRLRRRTAALSLALAVALVVTGALVERVANPAAAATSALNGAFRLVLPLLAFAFVVEVTDRTRLADSTWPLARYGVARRDVALGLVAAAIVAAAVACGVLAGAAAALAHGPADPPLARDAFTAAWIGGLTGAAYASWFAFGSSFFKRGGGRYAPLLFDFAIGGSTGVAGALLPRGEAQNLLGGAAPLAMSQPASVVALAGMTVVLGVLAALRCRD